jgi:hypothetical protein
VLLIAFSQLERFKEYMRIWETLAEQLPSTYMWLVIELVKVNAEIVQVQKLYGLVYDDLGALLF